MKIFFNTIFISIIVILLFVSLVILYEIKNLLCINNFYDIPWGAEGFPFYYKTKFFYTMYGIGHFIINILSVSLSIKLRKQIKKSFLILFVPIVWILFDMFVFN